MNLADLDEKYMRVEPARGGGYEPLPDGKYICRLERAEVRKNKGNDGKHLFLVLVVDEGAMKGRKVYHNRVIADNEKALAWLKNDLLAIGYNDYVSKLESLVGKCVGTRVRVTLKTMTNPGDGKKSQVVYLDPVRGR